MTDWLTDQQMACSSICRQECQAVYTRDGSDDVHHGPKQEGVHIWRYRCKRGGPGSWTGAGGTEMWERQHRQDGFNSDGHQAQNTGDITGNEWKNKSLLIIWNPYNTNKVVPALLQFILNVRLDYRLSFLLSVFKKDFVDVYPMADADATTNLEHAGNQTDPRTL